MSHLTHSTAELPLGLYTLRTQINSSNQQINKVARQSINLPNTNSNIMIFDKIMIFYQISNLPKSRTRNQRSKTSTYCKPNNKCEQCFFVLKKCITWNQMWTMFFWPKKTHTQKHITWYQMWAMWQKIWFTKRSPSSKAKSLNHYFFLSKCKNIWPNCMVLKSESKFQIVWHSQGKAKSC